MLSLTFARRLNPSQIAIPLISHSLPTKPSSNFHSENLNPRPNPQNFDSCAVFETLSCCSNDWKSALDFFNWVETECNFEHTPDTYDRMIDILGKFFEFDLSWHLIRRMKKSHCSLVNHATFRVLFKRYVSARLVKEAITIFDKLDEFNLKDDISYSILIFALCEHKHVMEAQELCFGKNMEAKNAMAATNKTKICNMILRGWFKMGWWNKCREFWEEMDRNGVNKDLRSYSIYMDVLCKGGKPWKAVKLYMEMKRKGMKLDVVAYTTVIRAIGLSQGVDSAMKVYKEMMEFGCMPNVATFNYYKSFCAKISE